MAEGQKHGPNRLASYLETHHTVIQQYIDQGFALVDGLTFSPFGQRFFLMHGEVRCAGGIVLSVSKLLRATGEGRAIQVRTVQYKYNARLEGLGNIVRYDSPHGHRAYHHRHSFNTLDGDRVGTIQEIGDDDWPTMGEVLEELRNWYYDNFHRIPAPTSE